MFRSALIAAASLAIMASVAHADIVNLSALGFVRYDPAGTTQDPTPVDGTLSPVIGTSLFANVDFPINGNNICKLTLVFADTNMLEGITARLFRKRISSGGPVNAPPNVMATAASPAGTSSGMRKVSTTGVAGRLIDELAYFYYVEVVAENFNTPLVGVQIEHKPTCP